MDPIRVMIIESHSQVRRALAGRLRTAPQVEVVGISADAGDGVAQAFELEPDVVLLDAKAAKTQPDGLVQVLKNLGRHRANVIVLATYTDEADRALVLRAGARRYLLKDVESKALLQAIQEAAAGRSPSKASSS